MTPRNAFLAFAIFCLSAVAVPAHATWPSDPNVGVPLCTATNDQMGAFAVPDGAGGAIVVWTDRRSGNDHIYAQRISAAGVPLWTANGVAVCTAANSQLDQQIIPDGAGGAIIAWDDFRNGSNYDVYAQRLNAAGVPQWTANGVAVCAAANDQYGNTVAPDGSGGAIVAWEDFRAGTDIYGQRLNSAGAPQWTLNGVPVCAAVGVQQTPVIATDAAGGAFIAWNDYRNGNSDIFAQRVNAAGAPQWTADGIGVCTAANTQYYQAIVADGVGGAIIAWTDFRNGIDDNLYAQRLSAAGTGLWNFNGTLVCGAINEQVIPTLVSDGAAGVIITWTDYRSGISYDVYAQRLNSGGGLSGDRTGCRSAPCPRMKPFRSPWPMVRVAPSLRGWTGGTGTPTYSPSASTRRASRSGTTTALRSRPDRT
jgi:hypothetical protein